MLLSGFYCTGSESTLLDCEFTIPSSSCDQYDVAGVFCEGLPAIIIVYSSLDSQKWRIHSFLTKAQRVHACTIVLCRVNVEIQHVYLVLSYMLVIGVSLVIV